MEDKAVVVLCTAPDNESGAKVARGLVDAKLAACVNIVPGLRSFFEWEGEVQDDAEVQLLIKTRAPRLPELEEWLNHNHPYDVPEILALPIEHGNRDYLSWLRDQTGR